MMSSASKAAWVRRGFHCSAAAATIRSEIAPTAKTLESAFAGSVSCSFDGGEGADPLTLHNENSTDGWTYTRHSRAVAAARPAALQSVSTAATSVENISVAGGSIRRRV